MTFISLPTCEMFYRHAMTFHSQDVLVRRAGVTDAAKRICTAFTSNHLDQGEEGLKASTKIRKALD